MAGRRELRGGPLVVAVAAGRGDREAPAGGDNNNRATANLEDEWAATNPDALLADILFCSGGDSGVISFWQYGQGPNEGW
jgi:hypothetical protein